MMQSIPQIQTGSGYNYAPSPQPPAYTYPPAQATQTQAAPVPPVSAPAYAPPSGQAPGAQNPQQAFQRQLTGLARTLEQAIPGYQFLSSVTEEVFSLPQGSSLPGAAQVTEILKEAVLCHSGALGGIRRLLCGDTSPMVGEGLALHLHRLANLHSRLRPALEHLSTSAPIELRHPLANLIQTLSTTDSFVSQAAQAAQSLVGPQVWENARARSAQVTLTEAW